MAGGGRFFFSGARTTPDLLQGAGILGSAVPAPLDRPRPRPLVRESSGGGLFVLGLATGLLVAIIIDRGARAFLDRDIELVRSVRDLALEEFVSEVDSAKLVDDALCGMLRGLDPYSHYYGPQEIAELDRETTGEFRGIGVVFRKTEAGRVLFPVPNSPADKAGLRVGDRILAIEGQDVSRLESDELLALLHRDRDEVKLAVEGLDGGRREFVLQPDVVLDPTVRHARMLDEERGIGYLAILSFSRRTPEEFDGAVEALERHGLHGLVVDLRSNPGGLLDAAVKVTNRFLRKGTIVVTRTRSETQVTEAQPDEARLGGLPLVLLIDQNSASASEVLAGALQDHCAAALIGEPSYGKGTVQQLKYIGRDRCVVKLTTSIYFTPSGRRIERGERYLGQGGIAPDLWIPLSDEERKAVYLFLHSYAPPESVLPDLEAWEEREQVVLIEEPPPDRQLEAAVALLAGEGLDLHGDALP